MRVGEEVAGGAPRVRIPTGIRVRARRWRFPPGSFQDRHRAGRATAPSGLISRRGQLSPAPRRAGRPGQRPARPDVDRFRPETVVTPGRVPLLVASHGLARTPGVHLRARPGAGRPSEAARPRVEFFGDAEIWCGATGGREPLGGSAGGVCSTTVA